MSAGVTTTVYMYVGVHGHAWTCFNGLAESSWSNHWSRTKINLAIFPFSFQHWPFWNAVHLSKAVKNSGLTVDCRRLSWISILPRKPLQILFRSDQDNTSQKACFNERLVTYYCMFSCLLWLCQLCVCSDLQLKRLQRSQHFLARALLRAPCSSNSLTVFG